MESYEEFCAFSLARLQMEKAHMCYGTSSQQVAHSTIQFHGMAVLSPLLSEAQRREMTRYRQRAVQLELEKQSLRRGMLLTRVQDILESVQVGKVLGESATPAQCPLNNMNATTNGLALLPDADAPPCQSVLMKRETSVNLDWTQKEVNNEEVEENEEENSWSLQTLLKKSKERVERGEGRRGSQGSCWGAPAPFGECLSDKENETMGGGSDSICGQTRCQPMSDSDVSSESLLGCPPRSLTGSYAQLPCPEPSLSPRLHRRRPRPVSTSNIFIACPMSGAELSPKKQEMQLLATWGAMPVSSCSDRGSPDPLSPGSLLLPSLNSPWNGERSGTSPSANMSVLASTPAAIIAGHGSPTTPSFHRQSHTLESPLFSDRSQKRIPRFLAGLPVWSRRSPPVPLNQSYDVESPSLMLQHRPQVECRLEPVDSQGPHESTLVLRHMAVSLGDSNKTAEEVQRQVKALEEMRRQLQEEHAQQLSHLIAEQEREQQRLRQELEEKERRLREQDGELILDEDPGSDWKALSDSCSILSPVCPAMSPAHQSLGHGAHSLGVSTLLSPHVPSLALQPPAYVWGSNLGPSKPRGRLSQAIPLGLQEALCRLGAMARGFLVRRLLSTGKLRQLRQTVQDTQEFIRSYQSETPGKRGPLSAQDVSLLERVSAQLRAALFDVHDIFFVMSLRERLALLQQDRELRAEKKLREMEKPKSPRDRVTLSAATQKSLDRKKQRTTDTSGQSKRTQQKPKSPHTNRILQPNQGQNALGPSQLPRQGSFYRKTPEERVKRSESLRKQHSLG